MARYVRDNMFEAHRGAMPWKQDGVTVIFGNDGYDQDDRVREAVSRVRAALNRDGIEVLGFGVEPEEGYSWAMLVGSHDYVKLYALVWTCSGAGEFNSGTA